MISSQIKKLNKQEYYDLIQPVCCIWILFDPAISKECGGSIIEIKYAVDNKYHSNPHFTDADFRQVRMFVVTVPGEPDNSDHTMSLVSNLLCTGLKPDDRIDAVEKLGIRTTETMRKGVSGMNQMLKVMAASMAEDMAKDIAKDMAEDMAKNMAKDMAEDMAEEKAASLAEGIIRNVIEALLRAGNTIKEIAAMTSLPEDKVVAISQSIA